MLRILFFFGVKVSLSLVGLNESKSSRIEFLDGTTPVTSFIGLFKKMPCQQDQTKTEHITAQKDVCFLLPHRNK